MKPIRRSFVVLAISGGVLLTACDAGKAPYGEAVTLEEQGKLAEAAEKYDSVCKRAPDSKMCPPSVERAADVRLKLADQLVVAMKFGDAEKIIKLVADSGDAKSKPKAATALADKPLVMGLRWDRASALADKSAAWSDIEEIAKSGTPIAAKASEWLTKERPALLLAKAKASCTPAENLACTAACDALKAGAVGTPQAGEADGLLAAHSKAVDAAKLAEAIRIYPLLVQAEDLLKAAAQEKKDADGRQACYLRSLAADPDNAIGALAFCGETDTKKVEKRKAAWDALVATIRDKAITDRLATRWKSAEDDGEYVRETPKKPDDGKPAPVAAKPAAARCQECIYNGFCNVLSFGPSQLPCCQPIHDPDGCKPGGKP
ncbi:MAG: hypothetical protein ACHREM_23665 [Polyangiales bacterium]